MPRYFFHLRGVAHEVRDPEGDDLHDYAEAFNIAHGLAHHLAQSMTADAADGSRACWIELADDVDEVLLRVPIAAPLLAERPVALAE